MSKDYYSTLGVDKTATAEEIKKAFRKKAHQYHPDKQGGDEAKFKEASEAYTVLSNAEKRKQYDQSGSTFNGAGFGDSQGGFNWQDSARQSQGSNSGGVKFDFGDLGDIFGDFGFSDIFGMGRRGGRPRRPGRDIQAELEIDFKESVFGVEKTVELYKDVVCDKCGGNGAEPGSKVSTCSACAGQGQVEKVQNTILGAMRTVGVCSDCRGEGKKIDKPCVKCRGTGIYKSKEKIKIKIPAGISNGQTIRLGGYGEAGRKGLSAGDLYINIRVRPSLTFKRQGDNIKTCEKISFKQAALGDKIEVETVHGPIKLKIPEGTQTGKIFKLRGKGVPHLNSAGAGDHLVEVAVITPTRLSRKAKKALEEL